MLSAQDAMDTSQTDLDPLNTTDSSGCTDSSGELYIQSSSEEEIEEHEEFCEPEIFIDLPKNTADGDFQPILEKMRAEWPDGNSKPFKLVNNPQPLSKFKFSHASRLLENLEQKDGGWCYKIPGLPVLRACIEHFKADRLFNTEAAFIGTRLIPMYHTIEHCGFDLMVDQSSNENNKRPDWKQKDLCLMAEWKLVNIHKTGDVAKVIRLTVQAHKQEKTQKSWLIILGDQARIYFLHYLGDDELCFGKSFEMRTKEGFSKVWKKT